MRLVLWLCAVFVLQLGFVKAQQNVPHPPKQNQSELLKNEIAASDATSKELKDKSAFQETEKIRDAREAYYVFSLKNRQEAFEWHLLSTQIIFFIVLVVVACGLVLSWMQFQFVHTAPLKKTMEIKTVEANKGTDNAAQEQESKGDGASKIEANTIEVSTSGVKITSSVVGLVILTLSIVFFFLYLHDVYPLKEVQSSKSETVSIKKDENKQ